MAEALFSVSGFFTGRASEALHASLFRGIVYRVSGFGIYGGKPKP